MSILAEASSEQATVAPTDQAAVAPKNQLAEKSIMEKVQESSATTPTSINTSPIMQVLAKASSDQAAENSISNKVDESSANLHSEEITTTTSISPSPVIISTPVEASTNQTVNDKVDEQIQETSAILASEDAVTPTEASCIEKGDKMRAESQNVSEVMSSEQSHSAETSTTPTIHNTTEKEIEDTAKMSNAEMTTATQASSTQPHDNKVAAERQEDDDKVVVKTEEATSIMNSEHPTPTEASRDQDHNEVEVTRGAADDEILTESAEITPTTDTGSEKSSSKTTPDTTPKTKPESEAETKANTPEKKAAVEITAAKVSTGQTNDNATTEAEKDTKGASSEKKTDVLSVTLRAPVIKKPQRPRHVGKDDKPNWADELCAIKLSDGSYMGTLDNSKDAVKQTRMVFRFSPGYKSQIEFTLEVPVSATNIGLISRPSQYILKGIIQSQTLSNEDGSLNGDFRPVTNEDDLPTVVTSLSNYQDLIADEELWWATFFFDPKNLVAEHLNNSVQYTGDDLKKQVNDFKGVFRSTKGKVFLNAVVRWNKYDGKPRRIFDQIWGHFKDDVEFGDMYRQYYPEHVRTGVEFPKLDWESLLPIPERPNMDDVKMPLTYPYGFNAMGTQLAYGLQQINEWEMERADKLLKGKENAVKIVGGVTKDPDLFLGVFRFKTSDNEPIRLEENTHFTFQIKRPRDPVYDVFSAVVASADAGVARVSTEVVAFIRRQQAFSRQPVKETKEKQLQPLGTALKATPVQGSTEKAVRDAIELAAYQPLIDVKLPASESTFKREMQAIAGIMKGTRERQRDGVSVEEEIPGIKNLQAVLGGARVSAHHNRNLLVDALQYFPEEQDPDAVKLMSYLQSIPNGIGLIQGGAGTGKTHHIALVARALCCRAVKVVFNRREIDPGHTRNPARILMTAPSNRACDVIVESLNEVIHERLELPFASALQKNILIARVHSDRTEESFLDRYAELLRDQTNDVQENERVRVALKNAGLFNAIDPDTHKLIDVEPKKRFVNPFGEGAQQTTSAAFSALSSIVGAEEKAMTPGDRIVQDERFRLVKNSLGFLMLQSLGLTRTENKFTRVASERHGKAKSLFLKSVIEGLSEDEEKDFIDAKNELRNDLLKQVDVLVTTHTNAGSGMVRKNFRAKVVFLDEGSMATIATTLVVMESQPGVPYIISADIMQLDPMVAGPKPLPGCAKLIPRSLFSVLLARHWPYVELTICRRSAANVNEIANSLFYRNALTGCSFSADDKKFPIKPLVMNFVKRYFPASAAVEKYMPSHNEKPFLHLNVHGQQRKSSMSSSTHNMENAAVVLNVIQALLEHFPSLKLEHFAIVVAYKDQEVLYNRARRRAIMSFPKENRAAFEKNQAAWMSLVIATTDSFQGGDNRIVFADYVVTDKIGFLNDRGRQCVASTRAKDYWFAVGLDENILKQDKDWNAGLKSTYDDYSHVCWPVKIYNAFTTRGRTRDLKADNPLLRHSWITSMSNFGNELPDDHYKDDSLNTWIKYKKYLNNTILKEKMRAGK